MPEHDVPSRRAFLATGAAAVVALTAAGTTTARSAPLPLTPTCVDDDDTPSNIEGPYFKRNSPQRTNLRTPGVTGVVLSITGFVYTMKCAPIPNALLDFWQADDRGVCDNGHGRACPTRAGQKTSAGSLGTSRPTQRDSRRRAGGDRKRLWRPGKTEQLGAGR